MTGRSSRRISGKPLFNVPGRGDTDGGAVNDPGSSQVIGDNHGNTNTDIQITGSRSSPAGLGDEQSIDIHFGKKEFICIPNINTAVTFTAIKFL